MSRICVIVGDLGKKLTEVVTVEGFMAKENSLNTAFFANINKDPDNGDLNLGFVKVRV